MVRLCSLGLNLIESPAGRIADRPRDLRRSEAQALKFVPRMVLRKCSPVRRRRLQGRTRLCCGVPAQRGSYRMLRTSVTRPAVLLEIEPSCCGFTTETTDIAPSRVPDALGARQFLCRTRSRSSGFASIPWSTGQPPLAACLALLINIARVSHRSDLQPRRPLRHQ